MSNPKVYVTQEVGNVDYTPATKFGDIVFVTSSNDKLSPFPSSLNNTNLMAHMERVLGDFTTNDFLVCTGAPSHMAIVGAMLGNRLKNLLVWDGRSMSYFVVKLK